jgi:hypothetical protein
MKRDEVFPSKYLKASDLGGKPLTVVIEKAPLEVLKSPEGKEEAKTVLYFRGLRKTLPLNRINWDSVAAIAGDDTDQWPAASIELYPSKTQMAGKTVDCIRIRPPAQPELSAKMPAAKSGPAKKKPAAAAKPKQDGAAEKPTLAEEMDDEVPFDL